MGWRFRRSIKILPGVKLNFNKNSTSVSIGSKHAGITFNSKTGVTARTSIPGTGLSYSEKISSPKKKAAPAKKTSAPLNERVKQMYIQQAQNDLRIIRESSKIAQETLKPEIFFSRLDLVLERYEHLASIEDYVSFNGERPSEIYAQAKSAESDTIQHFIKRYFLDAYQKARELKTTTGRENRIIKAFETLMLYQDRMGPACVSLAEKLRDDYLQKL